ncbi:hypothetical protein BD560DRAFT_202939 [Blakeslea trispora]|nr:hypothetical protein BD560DRAFT_202939 [Blakeslea trispora]
MSYTENPEDIFLQGIKEGDLIQDIDKKLTDFMQYNISSEFCATSFVPLLVHAASNDQSAEEVLVYSRILQNIYTYVLTDDPSNDCILTEAHQSILEIQSFLTREDITESTCLPELKSLAPIKLLTLMDIILNFMSPLLSKDIVSLYEPIVAVILDAIPELISQLVKLRYPKDTLLKASIEIIKSTADDLKHICLNHWTITKLLENLLILWDQGSLDEGSKDDIADAISTVIISAPEANKGDFLEIDALTVPLIFKEASGCNNIRAQALYYTFCLLVRNHVKPQIITWPEEQPLQSLSHIREKVALFFESDQKELSSQCMEIDPSSLPIRSIIRDQAGRFQQALQDRLEKITDKLTTMRDCKFDISVEDIDQLIYSMKEAVTVSGNTDWEDLFYHQMEHIVPLVIYLLTADEAAADSITSLFGHDVNGFLICYMHFALYYALVLDKEDILLQMATTINMTVEAMCIEHGHHIVIALMKEEDQAIKKLAIRRLSSLLKQRDPVRKLAQRHMTKITSTLAISLGNTKQKQKIVKGLDLMSSVRGTSISEHLSTFILAILEKINSFVFAKTNEFHNIEYPYALESVKELMVLLDRHINSHALHLIKLLQSMVKLTHMQSHLLDLWNTLINLLSQEALVQYLNAIVLSLFDVFRMSSSDVRERVVAALYGLLKERESTLSINCYANLPLIPPFDEFKELEEFIKAKIPKKMSNAHYRHSLDIILSNLQEADDIPVQVALDKLEKLLSDFAVQEYQLSQVYSRLLYIIHKYANNKSISLKAAICLGKLGALDPGLISVPTIDDTVFVINDFKRIDEVSDFVCELITNHLYPSYNAASNDTDVRRCIEYAIKPLLDAASLEPTDLTISAQRPQSKTHGLQKMPPAIQQFVAPFFLAAYEASWDSRTDDYPIFARAQSFDSWIQAWYLRMANSARDTAQKIFQALVPAVKSNLQDITQHLIPYLVLHSLLSGTGDDARGVIEELVAVIHANANAEIDHDNSATAWYRRALQVAVETTEYCRKWLNRVGRHDKEKESQVKRVNLFLQEMPRKEMGIAAFHAKAYPQSLMQFETYLKEKKASEIEDDMLYYLRQIYIQLENSADQKAFMEIYTTRIDLYTDSPNWDDWISIYESLGRWDDVEVHYKAKTKEEGAILSAYTGYLDCLKKTGSYDKMVYQTQVLSNQMPKWLPFVNSYRVDALWRLKEWKSLEESISLPTNRNIPALIGCILNEMYKSNRMEAGRLLDEARLKVIEQITVSQSKSYRRSYPMLFDLQLIEELEDSQVTSEMPDRAAHLRSLETRWKKNFGNIVPHTQCQLDLLHLRKAAYFGIRKVDVESATILKNIWLHIVNVNRKAGNMIAACDALTQAEQQSRQVLYRERAKLLWKRGQPKEAANLLMSKALHRGATFEEALLYIDIDLQHALDGDAKSMVKIINREGQLEGEKAEKANVLCIKWYGKRLAETHEEDLQINIKAYLMKRSISALQRGSKYYYTSMSTLLNCWLDVAKTGQKMRSSSTSELTELTKKITDVTESMLNITNVVPLYQFILFLPRLISNLSIDNDIVASSLAKIILEVFGAYPRHTVWLMLGAVESPIGKVRVRIRQIFERARAKFGDSIVPVVIQDAIKLREALHDLSLVKVRPGETDMFTIGQGSFLHLRDLQLHIPGERCLLPHLPDIITRSNSSYDPFGFDSCGSSLPLISRFEAKITVMKSLQMPKRITIIGSDGKKYEFLLKKEDDLRKDARTMEFNNMINTFLKKNPEARDSGLYIRTYSVVPLGNRWGLIEWIDNLNALKAAVNEYLIADGYDGVSALAAKFDAYKLGTASEKLQGFEKVLASCPPVFYKWFLHNFPEPNQWLNSRTRFIKTLAVMSIVGYCIGLGDRHAENIMFDEKNGDCVHVDLNLLFEGGSTLPTPEIVPFRLTRNLVDAMGILGSSGIFRQTCELTLEVLLSNKAALLAVYETHLNEIQSARDVRLFSLFLSLPFLLF